MLIRSALKCTADKKSNEEIKSNLFLQNAHNLFDVGAFSGVQQSQVDYSNADCELKLTSGDRKLSKIKCINELPICFVPIYRYTFE